MSNEQNAGAQVEPADVTALDLLAALLDAYKPTWFYQMGKTGYECSFCRAMVESRGGMGKAENHAAQCPYPQALAFVKEKGINL